MYCKFIFILLLIVSQKKYSQTVTANLTHAQSFYFKNNVYVYGYQYRDENLIFKCFRYSNSLILKDSNELNLGLIKPENYLEIETDTLHDVINFYFQLANQKNVVSFFRLNDSLKKISYSKNYDANHINTLTAFDDEIYSFKENQYIIRTTTDSTGKQFYLSKYHIKSMTTPFEYDHKWQYSFDRKFINRASIIHVDSNFVFIYANVFDGLKKGQWIIRLNAKTGELIKGTKLNAKNNAQHYLISNLYYDKKEKSLNLIGSVYQNEMIDFKNETFNFKNSSKSHILFIIKIDSLNDVVEKTEKSLLLPNLTNKLNTSSNYNLKVREFTKTIENNYFIWADIFEMKPDNVLVYLSSWQLNANPTDIGYNLIPSVFYNATTTINNFISFEKGDSYGKYYLKEASDYSKFKIRKQKNDVVVKLGLDASNNSFYVFKKTNISNSTTIFYSVVIKNKILEPKILLETKKNQQGNLYFIQDNKYISFLSKSDGIGFELKLISL